MKTADAVSRNVMGKPAGAAEQQRGGTVVHYAFGAGMGALLAGLAGRLPAIASARGALYGVAVWLAADQFLIPALGLSKPPGSQPAWVRAQAVASHVAYGMATESARRLLQRV